MIGNLRIKVFSTTLNSSFPSYLSKAFLSSDKPKGIDFINDSRRTNIDLDSGFIKFFYKFVFKPKLNIFLYADPDVILSRKQEMDKKSIVDLTNKYKSLFNELSNKHDQYYLPIENIEIDETMTEIENFLIKG